MSGFTDIPDAPLTEEMVDDFNDVRLMQLFKWTPDVIENLDMHWRIKIKTALQAQKNHDPKGQLSWWG